MKIPIISRLTSNKENWPAMAWIIKPMQNGPEIELDRARRVDEKENDDDIVAKKTRFELKQGGTTAPIPYRHIHNTSEGPLVILKSPEKGTYIPYELGSGDKSAEEALLSLKEIESEIKNDDNLQKKVGEDLDQLEQILQQNKSDDVELQKAIDNQEWMRWGKHVIQDIRHLTDTNDSWLDKYGTTIAVGLLAMLVIVVGVIQYMAMGDVAEGLNAVAESEGLIPVIAAGKGLKANMEKE